LALFVIDVIKQIERSDVLYVCNLFMACLVFAVLAILVCWVGHKVYLNMLKDEEKTKREIEKENNNL